MGSYRFKFLKIEMWPCAVSVYHIAQFLFLACWTCLHDSLSGNGGT